MTEREWGPQDWDEKSKEYADMGYIPVSMKNDFAQIYPDGITKAETQYQPPEAPEQKNCPRLHDPIRGFQRTRPGYMLNSYTGFISWKGV